MIIPPHLVPGDTVGIVAPSSHLPEAHLGYLPQAVKVIENWGLKVRLQSGIHHKHFYLAGSDQHRAEQFQALYTDPDIDGLCFLRGGYGASRLLRLLEPSVFQGVCKRVVGLSDATVLLNFLQQQCDMAVFHGPNVVGSQWFESPDKRHNQQAVKQALMSTVDPSVYHFSIQSIRPGHAEGVLIGGNLSLLVASLGTPYEVHTEGRLLFIEDVGEKPYRIDRMLTHLRNAGKFDGIAGILIGDMLNCDESEQGLLYPMLSDFFSADDFPVYKGLPTGHAQRCETLPLGLPYVLDAVSNELRLLRQG